MADFSKDDYVEITSDNSNNILHKEYLKDQPGENILAIFSFKSYFYISKVECRLHLGKSSAAKIFRYQIIQGEYANRLSIVNKSYAKDMQWTKILFRSYCLFGENKKPFFIVCPKRDGETFLREFKNLLSSSLIDTMPVILYEEWVLQRANIIIPDDFNGWQIQQVIKLCFSKLMLSESYFTCDSAQFFTSKFDAEKVLIRNRQIRTTAVQENREDKNLTYQKTQEKCWFNGELKSAGEVFDNIDSFFVNPPTQKYHYIGCNGSFDSSICISLEDWSMKQGMEGIVGLIRMAPYEFAWYGSFVTYMKTESFYPIHPDFFSSISSADDIKNYISSDVFVGEGKFGFLFQPPASDVLNAENSFQIALERIVKSI